MQEAEEVLTLSVGHREALKTYYIARVIEARRRGNDACEAFWREAMNQAGFGQILTID